MLEGSLIWSTKPKGSSSVTQTQTGTLLVDKPQRTSAYSVNIAQSPSGSSLKRMSWNADTPDWILHLLVYKWSSLFWLSNGISVVTNQNFLAPFLSLDSEFYIQMLWGKKCAHLYFPAANKAFDPNLGIAQLRSFDEMPDACNLSPACINSSRPGMKNPM